MMDPDVAARHAAHLMDQMIRTMGLLLIRPAARRDCRQSGGRWRHLRSAQFLPVSCDAVIAFSRLDAVMKRLKKRYVVVATILMALIGGSLWWCKVDGVVSVHRGFESHRVLNIEGVHLHPYLMPSQMRREPGRWFKQQILWDGPYSLRVSFRDHSRKFQEARLQSCTLRSSDGTWNQTLVEAEAPRGWQQSFQDPRWTDDFNELVFVAGAGSERADDIVLPRDIQTFVLEMTFDLTSSEKTESFQKTIELRPAANSYSSDGFDRMIAF